ncbi:MAG TPA: NUDIX domain-containing protein [Candidatus Saccharimonadales bacterium]|jgi:ADP-ribose pyrophosphatase YjhB (NUDIX family)|nr:NUDIX domain-containing protein [Candidatus Saccharimonadales bacterium]
MLMRVLALLFNAFPVRWQRRFMTAAHERFLVGVTGLGVDPQGRVLLARHRFGAPQWRFLGGFLGRRERVEDALAREIREETGLSIEVGPLLEVVTGFRWARVELVFAFRLIGGAEALTAEVAELGWFRPDALPDVRADQRGLIERHIDRAREWAGRG